MSLMVLFMNMIPSKYGIDNSAQKNKYKMKSKVYFYPRKTRVLQIDNKTCPLNDCHDSGKIRGNPHRRE